MGFFILGDVATQALADTASAVSAGLPVETDAIRGELLAALEVAEPEIRRLGTVR